MFLFEGEPNMSIKKLFVLKIIKRQKTYRIAAKEVLPRVGNFIFAGINNSFESKPVL